MIAIYGKPGDEPGDQLVYRALEYLPAGWLAYAQPKIILGNSERNPDYVLLHQDYGYVVLEVKDYLQVERPSAKGAWIRRTNRFEPEWENSPVEQGRKAAELLNNKLVRNPDLRNYCGKLDFSYRYAGILPHIPSATISWLSGFWGEGKVLGSQDLAKEVIFQRISSIPTPFTAQMTERQFDAVRAVLDQANLAVNIVTGEVKGIYSSLQEQIAKSSFLLPTDQARSSLSSEKQEMLWGDLLPEPEARLDELERNSPKEVLELRTARSVRLVRGFSGTGKTDVLVMRARYLYDLYPEINALVTTFNTPLIEQRFRAEFSKHRDRIAIRSFDSLCKEIFQRHTGTWPTIQDVGGLIRGLATMDPKIAPLIEKYGPAFLTDEITWMKEVGLSDAEKYVETHREGRARVSGQILGRSRKAEIYQIYAEYQRRLVEMRAFDWPDMHKTVWEFLQKGDIPKKTFDLIFIDEAQHFAPLWIKIVLSHLAPGGSVFICDDPSQSVYRYYSWEQKGIQVRGRTRWLRIPYRTTREIFEAGYALIQSNPLARGLIDEGEREIAPILAEDMRTGPRPQLYQFNSYEREKDFISKQIAAICQGILPSEIAILHTEKHVRAAYTPLVPSGVVIDDLRRRTGMEYKVVFIPQLQQLFAGDQISFDLEQIRANHQLALYMAMTRARDRLYLSYGSKWPKEYEPIRAFVDFVEG